MGCRHPGGGTDTFSAVHCFPAPPNGRIEVTGQAGNHTRACDLADDYTFSLAGSGDGDTLALSLYSRRPKLALLMRGAGEFRRPQRLVRVELTAMYHQQN